MDEVKNFAIILGSLVGLLTLIKAVYEYTKQSAQKRAEEFFKIDRIFVENKEFMKLIQLLDDDSEELIDFDIKVKTNFLRFYENVALMINSGLIRKHVAHYMFSYYSLNCWDSDKFWESFDREDAYWALFVQFVKDMKAIDNNFSFNRKNYKL